MNFILTILFVLFLTKQEYHLHRICWYLILSQTFPVRICVTWYSVKASTCKFQDWTILHLDWAFADDPECGFSQSLMSHTSLSHSTGSELWPESNLKFWLPLGQLLPTSTHYSKCMQLTKWATPCCSLTTGEQVTLQSFNPLCSFSIWWNELPTSTWTAEDITYFKKQLKAPLPQTLNHLSWFMGTDTLFFILYKLYI